MERGGKRTTKNYGSGFSLMGLILCALQLLPNIVWVLRPPANNVLTKNSSPYLILNIIEHVFGIMTVVLLVLLINKGDGRNSNAYIVLAMLVLAGYYTAWILYYKGVVSPWLLIAGLAGMPPLYFFFAGLWMKNHVALIPWATFGIAHVAITCSTYLKS